MGDIIKGLKSSKASGQMPSPDQQRALTNLPSRVREKLCDIGILTGERLAVDQPLDKLVTAWGVALSDKGDKAQHVVSNEQIVRRIFAACKFKTAASIRDEKVLPAINGFKKTVLTVDEVGIRSRKDLGGLSAASRKYYLRTVKEFFRWLAKTRQINASPIEHLELLAADVKTFQRRGLSLDELDCLLAYCEAAGPRCGCSGYERATLYYTAVGTGLRVKELRSLKAEDFRIDATPPVVVLSGLFTKNKKEALQCLPPELVDMLRPILLGKLPGVRVFVRPGKKPGQFLPHEDGFPRMLRKDMAAAREKWIEAAKNNPPEYDRRGKSDFLKTETPEGRLDFHGLRHSTASLLMEMGIAPKVAQVIMRHSSVGTTMNTYTHARMESMAAVAAAFPRIRKANDQDPGVAAV